MSRDFCPRVYFLQKQSTQHSPPSGCSPPAPAPDAGAASESCEWLEAPTQGQFRRFLGQTTEVTSVAYNPVSASKSQAVFQCEQVVSLVAIFLRAEIEGQ